jgi:CSLREA domain-containing protein
MSAKVSGTARNLFAVRLHSNVLIKSLWLALAVLVPAATARAATYTVTTLSDTGNGSLRTAMSSAMNDPAGNIVFASGLTGTITLDSSLPNVTLASGSMTITGPAANKLTISGQGKYEIMAIVSGTVNLSGVTISNGYVGTGTGYSADPGVGGAIYMVKGSALNVSNSAFLNNTSALSGGGAIVNDQGTLTVTNTLFLGNVVTAPGFGGAIYNLGPLKVTGSTFAYNEASYGSAILNYYDAQHAITTATISDSTFAYNTVIDPGCPGCGQLGGIDNYAGATLTVTDSTFYGNTNISYPNLGASIANYGTMTLSNNVIVEGVAGQNQCVAAAAPATPCPAVGSAPDASGNFDDMAANLKLLPLGYYGGLTPTMPPPAGSELICGGTTAGAKNANGGTLTSDQRGFGIDPTCATGKVDAGAVQTNYLTVTTTADNGGGTCGASCTLRDAIASANASGHADIQFGAGVTGTITLGSALPALSGTADLIGPGANVLTVSGNNAYPVFNVTTGTLDVTGLTIANGKSASSGGAIENTGGLVTLTNAWLSNNTAASNGGAVDNGGTVLASGTTFSGNKAALGSAIYNAGAVNASYSTYANNAAGNAGGIYNNSGAALTLVSSTLAANTGTTGAGIDSLGSLTLTNSLFDASAACAGTGCATTGAGNVLAATGLAPLGNYGGTVPTVLPQPGSSAICAGSPALVPANALTDQRGFASENITYTGYSATAPCVDAGAVQTNYTSAQFVSAGPYTATANVAGTTPALVASVTENGQNIGGVPVTLTFSGTGSATGLTATTAAGTGATFSGLTVNAGSAPTDSLAIDIPVVGSDVLTAPAVSLTVTGGAKTTPTITTWPTASTLTPGQTLASSTLTGGVASVSGTFAFTNPAIVPPSGTSSQSVTFTPSNTASYNTVVGSVSVTVGTPTSITPYIEVNGGAWQTTTTVTVQYSDSVNLGPQPLTGGSWSWTGPNGYRSTSREIDNIPLTAPSNVFVATYTNPSGIKSTLAFTINVAPTAITPYFQVNGGFWQTATTVTAQYNDSVNLGPQPLTGGSWNWTGPNGYTSTSRQINNVPLTAPVNVFIATYTNPAGVKSTMTFTIRVAPTTITPYLQVGYGWWQNASSTIVFFGPVNLGPQPLTGGSWIWTGPNGFRSTSREIDNIPLFFGYNNYVVTYTNPAGVQSTQTFTILAF